ncbi:hypothetical protein DC852_25130, partial [Vibrio parahaemolyticus]|nr:hypothetical protein [Vibrio parahaemolyticus]
IDKEILGVFKVLLAEGYLAIRYFWEIFYMRGELLRLNAILRKFYINKPFWLIGIFRFLFIYTEFSRNYCDVSNRIASP